MGVDSGPDTLGEKEAHDCDGTESYGCGQSLLSA